MTSTSTKKTLRDNEGDRFGETSLHTAAFFGHQNCVKELLKARADVNAKNKRNETPLHKAFIMNRYSIAYLLLANGADVLALDYQGLTPYGQFLNNLHDSSRVATVEEKKIKELLEALMWKAQCSSTKNNSKLSNITNTNILPSSKN